VCSRLATQQEGAVRYDQLRTAGLTLGEIRHLVDAGGLHVRYRGVYIVGHLAFAPMANEAAALLACGSRAVISHRSAAYLWGLLDRPDEVDVTLVGVRRRPQDGLSLHYTAGLGSRDVVEKGCVRLTSAARTIVDLASEASFLQLEALIAEARAKRILRSGELERAVRRAGRRKGVRRLKAILRSHAGHALTRSETERLCRRLLEAAGLPQPITNQRLAGCEVDFLWPDARVVLEVDTITFHGHARAFEWDRRKTMVLENAGYHVIRVTRRQLREEPLWVIAHIARALERYGRAAA
jgi:very-short-patch-repair endonuclease